MMAFSLCDSIVMTQSDVIVFIIAWYSYLMSELRQFLSFIVTFYFQLQRGTVSQLLAIMAIVLYVCEVHNYLLESSLNSRV